MTAQMMSSQELVPGPAQGQAHPQSETSSMTAQFDPEEADLERIRDLLFGPQVRNREQQLQALETQITTFQTAFEGRLERLEAIVTQGFDSITQQLQVERKERIAAIATTENALGSSQEHSLQNLGEEVQRQQAQLSQKLDLEAQSLRQEILDHSSQLTEALHHNSQDFLRAINQESERRQQQERAHRSRLSGLFGELSERLND